MQGVLDFVLIKKKVYISNYLCNKYYTLKKAKGKITAKYVINKVAFTKISKF